MLWPLSVSKSTGSRALYDLAREVALLQADQWPCTGTVGHTISNREMNAGTLNLAGGVSFNFTR